MHQDDSDRSCALAFLLACLSGAVYLPLRHKHPFLFQLMLLPCTALFLYSVIHLLLSPRRLLQRLGASLSWPCVLGWTGLGLQLLALPMHAAQASKYASVGYAPNWPLAAAGYGLSAFLFGWLGLRGSLRPRSWLWLTLGSYLFTAAFSLLCYPVVAARSDMLPILEASGRDFLAHPLEPARVYQPKEALSPTYLPGLWFSYLPATFLNLDLRAVSVASTAACAGLLVAAAGNRVFLACALLQAFLLSPLFQFRHETYLQALLGFAGAYSLCLLRGRLFMAALLLGWLCAMSQLGWFIAPFFIWHAWRAAGPVRSLGPIAACILIPGLVIGPFALAEGSRLFETVFAPWQRWVWAEGPNVSFWITRLLPFQHLQKLQAALLAALFILASRRLGPPGELLKWSALALIVFIMTNTPIRDYFFFLPCLFIAFHALASAGQASSARLEGGG